MQPTQQEAQEYIAGLLEGTIEPSDKYAVELVAQMKAANEELGKLSEHITKLQGELQRAETRKIALSAVVQQTGSTLLKFRPEEAAAAGEPDETAVDEEPQPAPKATRSKKAKG